MALHDDLLSQARYLATADVGPLLQANLRRAISSAYYALFHLLVSESVALLVPAQPSGLAARVSRAFTHAEMNRVCGGFAKAQLTDELRALLPQGVLVELKIVAATFTQLQQARHSADYDIDFTTIRSFALTRIAEAENAFIAWYSVRDTEEAAVFLTALAFAGRWSK